VILGAAGSGKTTTALLRLKALCTSRLERRARLGQVDPVRVMVQTYNRTLEGYIAELARDQVPQGPGLVLDVTTFSRWAVNVTGQSNILDREASKPILNRLLAPFTSDHKLRDFYIDEVEYALGRLDPGDLESYMTMVREGRGQAPRVERGLRRRLLDEVIGPYQSEKVRRGRLDWNDIAVAASTSRLDLRYDVVIVDEAQDFSANQIRAVVAHLAQDHSTTFVLDAVQRIYPRSFRWSEVGIDKQLYSRLATNYRNTANIAAFARPLVEGLPQEDDGSLPDFLACEEAGEKPKVISGSYSAQLKFMLDETIRNVDLTDESVAIMQPLGGGWFDFTRAELNRRGLPFVELTRNSTWPRGTEQVGLSTISSAKGLEFDHVLLPGLNQKVTPHGFEEGDAALDRLRRLLAMGIGRARKTVMVGFKADEKSSLIELLDPSTYEMVEL
jgi:DNA helicase IV